MLSLRGILLRKHLQIGVLKGAITQEQADSKLAAWVESKESQLKTNRDNLDQSKQANAKARKDAETKVKEARAEAIRKKAEAAAAAAVATPAEGEATAPTESAEAQG
jgi:small subunit ribosomal protein S16